LRFRRWWRVNRRLFDHRGSSCNDSWFDDGWWWRRLDTWRFGNDLHLGRRRGRGGNSLGWRRRRRRRRCFFNRSRRRGLRRPDGFDQPRRSKDGRRRLGWLRLLWRGGLLRTAFCRRRRFGEHVTARQRDAALPRNALDKRSGDDLFDGARRALQLDAVIAFEQRQHFLAGGAEQLRDFVNPDCCQCVPLVTKPLRLFNFSGSFCRRRLRRFGRRFLLLRFRRRIGEQCIHLRLRVARF